MLTKISHETREGKSEDYAWKGWIKTKETSGEKKIYASNLCLNFLVNILIHLLMILTTAAMWWWPISNIELFFVIFFSFSAFGWWFVFRFYIFGTKFLLLDDDFFLVLLKVFSVNRVWKKENENLKSLITCKW